MANAKKLTGGTAVAALAWLAIPGVASAASVNTTPSAVDTTQCLVPLPPGSPTYGDGTPASADRAFVGLPSGGSSSSGGQLAFTGGNFSKEIMLGLAFIGGGAVMLYRNGRRTLALASDGLDDATPED